MNPEPTPDNTSGQPPAPATVAQARPSVAPAPQSQYQQPPVMHKKSRTGLIIAAILGGLLLIGVILFALIGIPAYSAIQARATATTFMSAVKYNDEAVMKKLSGKGRDGITDKAHEALSKEGVSYEASGADKTESEDFIRKEVSWSCFENSSNEYGRRNTRSSPNYTCRI